MMRVILLCLLLPMTVMAQQINIAKKVKFLALGDSYTIGESVSIEERWPVQLTNALRKRGVNVSVPKIIATTGWRTDNLSDALVRAKLRPDYNLVSLLIGVNNFYQGRSVESFKPEFEALLKKAINLAGGDKTHVFVVSIPDYGYTPFGKADQSTITADTDNFNSACKDIALKNGVTFINITDISRRGIAEPDLVADDGLHPSKKMYGEWVQRILEQCTIQP